MRTHRITHLFALASLSVPVTSQTVVSPAHFSNAQTSAGIGFTGTGSGPFRWMQVHDDMAGSPRLIRAVATRPIWRITTPFSVTLSASCSTATTTAAAPAQNFDMNHGLDRVQVVTNRTYNFPPIAPGPLPAPFAYDLQFDVPFPFTSFGPLCWDVQVHTDTKAMNPFHSYVPSFGQSASHYSATHGTGCRVSTQSAPMDAYGSAGPGTVGSIVVNGERGPRNGVVLLVLGVNDRLAFGSIPLPFAIPNTAGAPSGLCQLYTDISLEVATATDANGKSVTTIPFSRTPHLNGLTTLEQVIGHDPGANPVGIVTSNAVSHNFTAPAGPPPVGMVFGTGTPAAGSANAGGMVIRFTF